jgi:hypothetical protein
VQVLALRTENPAHDLNTVSSMDMACCKVGCLPA